MLLSFVGLYSAVGSLVVWVAYNLKFGEFCSPYSLIPILGIFAGDWFLERINIYFANTLRKPLSKRINFDVYMGILNAFMYSSIYTAGSLWFYRLSGKFVSVPIIMLLGLISGFYTLRKIYR